ncbi:hypothetical protein [Kribbella sp. NPDC051770]
MNPGPDDLRLTAAEEILPPRPDDDWVTDRELIDHEPRHPWASEGR